MNSTALDSLQRVVFLGSPEFELAVPTNCAWARAAYVPLRGGWPAAIAKAGALDPTGSVFFDPRGLQAVDLAKLGGIRIGIATQALTTDELAELGSLARRRATGFQWVTLFERLALPVEDLPVLQMLPRLIDTSRLPSEPQLDTLRAVVPHGAMVPEALLADVRPLPSVENTVDLPSALFGAGILFYHGLSQRLGRDPLPLLALALGLLLVCDEEFPVDWGIEKEDEYLVRSIPEWKRTLLGVVQAPHSFRAVRIRAWQKVREMFDASLVFRRLIHDALLFTNA